MATVNLLPNSEGSVQQWFPYPSLQPSEPHWNKVDDPVGNPDEDFTYVYARINNYIEDFNHVTSALLAGATISNVRLTVRARKTGADDVGISLGLRIALPRYPSGVVIPVTTSYAYYSYDWSDNPADSQPWEKSDIDALQSSLQCIIGLSFNPELRCTQVYLTVTYVTPVPGKGLVSWTP